MYSKPDFIHAQYLKNKMYSKPDFIRTFKAISTLARLRMTIFSAVTYACAASVGSSMVEGKVMITVSPIVFLCGWAFIFVCQVSAHLLGEYYDLPSDRYSYLASPSPFTGGSRVLVSATNASSSVISPKWCKYLGHFCTLMAFAMTLVGLAVLDLGEHQYTVLLLSWLMIVIAHQYSAPPLKLNHRALGEFSAALVMNILLPYFGGLINLCNKTVPTNLTQLHTSLAFLIIPNFFLKITVFLILNWADRRADFLGGKSTLALIMSPRNLMTLLCLLLVLTYLSAILVVFLVPDALSLANIFALILTLATAPLAIDLLRRINPSASRLSPATMKAVLRLAPLPVVFLFVSHFAFKFIGHPFQVFRSPITWVRILPLLPFLQIFFVQGTNTPPNPNFLTKEPLLANNTALQTNFRVVIVGGGIAGLMTAVELQSLGTPFVVLEQRANAEEANRGADLGLWPSAREILEKFITDKEWWLENSVRISQVKMQALSNTANDEPKLLRTVNMETVTNHRGFYLVARQPLMQKLRSLIKSEFIVYAARVTKITECETFATVNFLTINQETKSSKIHEENAQLVIGADGINSVCRPAIHDILNAGLDNTGESGSVRYAGEICYRGVVDMTRPDAATVKQNLDDIGANTMPLLMGPGLRASYSYINENQSVACWWVKEKFTYDQTQSTNRNNGEKLNSAAKWPNVLIKLRELTDGDNLHVQNIADRVTDSKWCSHRIVLVGDAAHPVTPNLAQGASMAIEDAHCLIHALKSNQHQVDGFIQYVEQRQAHANNVSDESFKQAKLGQISNPVLVWLRELILQYMPTSMFEGRLKNVNMWEDTSTSS